MSLQVVLDQDKCSGLGLCEAEAPEIFEVREDGSLAVLDETPADEHRMACEAAVAACPTEALRLIES
ncbi:ferredoxin [Pseudonocardia sp. KRD291]|uniref:ferredoxin n=1 Tax=Pseudonocardia sp. KRD291 TaxID=2792007 RepID=UPI001C4A5ECD|nr:ferredoxin [Pseudonocardia sp. KRD291]MBW0101182.1 ferredoxin [Pseudonocardia sp. KRD291]